MPSTSEDQRAFFCIALDIKQGKTPKSYSAEAAKAAEEMSEEELKEMCESPIEAEE